MNYCVVERDLAAYERRVEAEYRLEEARDRAIAVERERLDELTVAELLGCQAPLIVRWRDVSDSPSSTTVRLDLDSIVDAIAAANVEAAAA